VPRVQQKTGRDEHRHNDYSPCCVHSSLSPSTVATIKALPFKKHRDHADLACEIPERHAAAFRWWIKEYRIGIVQDMDTEPILYYQLGEILEEAKLTKEAIETYREYLRLDPDGEYASAVESIIERLKEDSTVKQ